MPINYTCQTCWQQVDAVTYCTLCGEPMCSECGPEHEASHDTTDAEGDEYE